MGKEHWSTVLHEDDTPGPGAYDIPSSFCRDSHKFSIRNRFKQKTQTTDTEYINIPNTLSSRSVFLPPHCPPDENENSSSRFATPGPSYIPEPMGKKPVSARRGRSTGSYEQRNRPEKKSYNKNPFGPAEYNVSINMLSKDCGVTIGKGCHLNERDSSVPGPGSYEIPAAIDTRRTRSKKESTFGSRNPISRGNVVSPGPMYMVESPRGSKYGTIHSRCSSAKENDVPGPGSYDIPSTIGKRTVSLNKGKWRSDKNCNDAPYYSLPSTLDKRKKTIGKRNVSSLRRKAERAEMPGPGFYNPEKPRHIHGYSMGKGRQSDVRKTPKDKKADECPGPCSYSPNYFAGKKSSPRFSFKDGAGAVSSREHEPTPPYYGPSDKLGDSSPRIKIRERCKYVDRNYATQDAGYYMLPDTNQGPYHAIHLRDKHRLVPV